MKRIGYIVLLLITSLGAAAIDIPKIITKESLRANPYVFLYSEKDKNNNYMVVFKDSDRYFTYCLYTEENEMLHHIMTLPHLDGDISQNFTNGVNEDVNYPFDVSAGSKVIAAHDLNNDGELEYFIERVVDGKYYLDIYEITATLLSKLAEIEGYEYFYYTDDGQYEVVGHAIRESSMFDLASSRYFYYYFTRSGQIVKKDFLSPVLYQKLFAKFEKRFNASRSISDFSNLFLFQYAGGYRDNGVKWFKKNKNKIANYPEKEKDVASIAEYFFIK